MIIEICVDGGNYDEIELTDGVLSEAAGDLDLAVDFEVANFGDKLENWERIDYNYLGGAYRVSSSIDNNRPRGKSMMKRVHRNIENDCIKQEKENEIQFELEIIIIFITDFITDLTKVIILFNIYCFKRFLS